MEHYLGVAKEEGITDDELGAMQFMEALARVKKKDEPVDPDCSETCP
jgi:hypothetical protein